MLRLHEFSVTPQSYAKTTLSSDAELGRLLGLILDSPEEVIFDYDTLWREVILFSPEDDAARRLTSLLEQSGCEAGTPMHGLLGAEVPTRPAEGISKRTYLRNKQVHTAEVAVSLEPCPAGSGLQVDAGEGLYAPVLAHGVRRAGRLGPCAHLPVTDARVTVRCASAGETAPALADLHAAATLAATRAFQGAGIELVRLSPERVVVEQPQVFPDMENSAADTFANLQEVFAYPVDALAEEEKTQLGSFVAYLLSLLFGHQLDERMRRQPKRPPDALRRILAHLAAETTRLGTADGRTGAELVIELLGIWTREWSNPAQVVAASTEPVMPLVAPPDPLEEEEEVDEEDDSGC